jgi:hypothetical protein
MTEKELVYETVPEDGSPSTYHLSNRNEACGVCLIDLVSDKAGATYAMTIYGVTPEDALEAAVHLARYAYKRYAMKATSRYAYKAPKAETTKPEPLPGEEPASQAHDESWCPIHKTEMKYREKDGEGWYSHKLKDDSWCNGKKGK